MDLKIEKYSSTKVLDLIKSQLNTVKIIVTINHRVPGEAPDLVGDQAHDSQ